MVTTNQEEKTSLAAREGDTKRKQDLCKLESKNEEDEELKARRELGKNHKSFERVRATKRTKTRERAKF